MILIGIDEDKYSLQQVIKNTSSEPTTQKLLEVFHHKLRKNLIDLGFFWKVRTHIRGITYFSTDQKAFLMLNLTRRFLSCIFFTGHGSIKGLNKGIWLNKGETCGSERFRIKDDESIDRAVRFAIDAHILAKEWAKKVKHR